VRAEVHDLSAFSVHADANELVAWVASAASPPRITFAVHGEPEPAKALAGRIDRELGWPAVVPGHGEVVRL
jgi:metallo-beta-lactamase family protein